MAQLLALFSVKMDQDGPTQDSKIQNVETQIRARAYQLEMLSESLKKNVIVAMDTGSGKTHVAILRIMTELDRSPDKLTWFLAPKVSRVLRTWKPHQIATLRLYPLFVLVLTAIL